MPAGSWPSSPPPGLPAGSPFREHDPKRALFADPRLVSAEIVPPDLANSLLVRVRQSSTVG
jgi:hypothetical protein